MSGALDAEVDKKEISRFSKLVKVLLQVQTQLNLTQRETIVVAHCATFL